MQVQYESSRKGGLNLLVSYTLSKMMLRTGWMDELNLVPQQSLFNRDTPHRVSVAGVWELPFGRGRRFLNSSHGLWHRLAGGWESSVIFQYQPGWPWPLPGNAILLKDPRLPEIDWPQPVVRAIDTCAARWNDNGAITMASSVQRGCTSYTWLVMPRYGPNRWLPNQDGRIRLHSVPIGDLAINKMTGITEKVRAQFRFEVFNLTNTYMHNRQNFNTSVENVNFGTLNRAAVSSTGPNFPRNIQLGFKVLW